MDTGILKGIIGLLFIGALFYFVIRKARGGGCCGHSHERHNPHEMHSKKETDPGKTKGSVL
jgi:hypothetical protein